MDVQDFLDVGSVSLSRSPLFQLLVQKMLTALKELSNALPTMPVSKATTMLSIALEAWAAAISLILDITNDHLDVLRSMESYIPVLLTDPACTAEERCTLELTSQMMQARLKSPPHRSTGS